MMEKTEFPILTENEVDILQEADAICEKLLENIFVLPTLYNDLANAMKGDIWIDTYNTDKNWFFAEEVYISDDRHFITYKGCDKYGGSDGFSLPIEWFISPQSDVMNLMTEKIRNEIKMRNRVVYISSK